MVPNAVVSLDHFGDGGHVHRSVENPFAFAPLSSRFLRRVFWLVLRRQGRPGWGVQSSPRSPLRRWACRHRRTLLESAPTRSATSEVKKPLFSNSIACRRRRSNSAALPLGLMNQCIGICSIRALTIQGSVSQARLGARVSRGPRGCGHGHVPQLANSAARSNGSTMQSPLRSPVQLGGQGAGHGRQLASPPRRARRSRMPISARRDRRRRSQYLQEESGSQDLVCPDFRNASEGQRGGSIPPPPYVSGVSAPPECPE